MRLVGFSGCARSGKDTAARALLSRGWARLAFADALKDDLRRMTCRALFEAGDTVTDEFLDAWDAENKELVRPLMVEYGRLMRLRDPGHWIRRAEAAMPTGDVAVTDVRYTDEVGWIRRRGGIVVGIVRPGVAAANDEEAGSLRAVHPDLVIVNCSTVEELHRRVLAAVYGRTEEKHE
jgi:hypothetical protein